MAREVLTAKKSGWGSKVLALATAASLIWMGYDALKADEKPSGADDSDVVPVNPVDEQGKVHLKTLSEGETFGLLLVGAQNGGKVLMLQDPRDLCTVVKSNALLNMDLAKDESRFSKEFETCADRTLHYEASLLSAGFLMGETNVRGARRGDYCGIVSIAELRATFQYRAQAGLPHPDKDTAVQMLNDVMEICEKQGDFIISETDWNKYANQGFLYSFYPIPGK